MTPLDSIQNCIEEKKCFVLQGGAGSGKTETLKETLKYISENYPDKKVACITHTNLAVNEIKSRVGDQYTISTIHSFLNSIIKDYKKNIFQCIFELFKVENIERNELDFYNDEKEQKKKEHDKYKNIYEKYAKRFFTVTGESIEKPEGKKIYDAHPITYNTSLNTRIDELTEIIKSEIETKDFNKIQYNETLFDSYNDLTFGHDGLLEIAYQLFSNFPKIGKILQDKYDYILIDEYQDTNLNIIQIFLNYLPIEDTTTIGLFGDAMQSIYKDGIGNVQKYISDGILKEIIKEDNYRCSVQVVDFINNLRNDELLQRVELKHSESSIDERQGNVNFYYSIVESKPTSFSSQETKDDYVQKLNQIIEYAKGQQNNSKLLMLTNKSISQEVNFNNLYNTFNQRYREPKEYIDKALTQLQFIDLVEICEAYENNNYNYILSKLKKSGYPIKTIEDKRKLKTDIEFILGSSSSAIDIITYAFSNNLIKKSESYNSYMDRKSVFLQSLDNDGYREFKSNYNDNKNTLKKMKDDGIIIEEEQFKELEKELKKEKLFLDLFSDVITFSEIINYYKYINEDTNYITMHKTKGSSIENVIVVLDEYFWNDYNFSKIYDPVISDNIKFESQKLFYVACSRTEKNLTCVRLIKSEEEGLLNQFFSNATRIDL